MATTFQVVLQAGQSQPATLIAHDGAGAIDTVTPVKWLSNDTTKATVMADALGRQATITAGNKVGQVNVTATCGTAVVTFALTVTAGAVASLDVALGQVH